MCAHTSSLKLKVNMVHIGVAELVFISVLTIMSVCTGLDCTPVCAANNEHEFHPC